MTSFIWGQDKETGQWWLVLCKNGEPHLAYHPEWGERPAYLNTFVRWHASPDIDSVWSTGRVS